jgi:hypothetical protein
MILEFLNKLFNYLGDFWALLPKKDRRLILNIWGAYLKLVANEHLKTFQSDISSGISTTPIEVARLWQYFPFIYEYDCSNEIPFENMGNPTTDYNATSDPIISATWDEL